MKRERERGRSSIGDGEKEEGLEKERRERIDDDVSDGESIEWKGGS